MLSKPLVDGCPDGDWYRYAAPKESPKLGVICFEKSNETDVSRVEGSSSDSVLRDVETVGNESSSETNGSSVVIVAGKNRLPAKPCGCPAIGSIASAATTMPGAHLLTALPRTNVSGAA